MNSSLHTCVAFRLSANLPRTSTIPHIQHDQPCSLRPPPTPSHNDWKGSLQTHTPELCMYLCKSGEKRWSLKLWLTMVWWSTPTPRTQVHILYTSDFWSAPKTLQSMGQTLWGLLLGLIWVFHSEWFGFLWVFCTLLLLDVFRLRSLKQTLYSMSMFFLYLVALWTPYFTLILMHFVGVLKCSSSLSVFVCNCPWKSVS